MAHKSDIELEIEKALSAEDQYIAAQFEELGLIGQFRTVFQGKTAWVSVAALIVGTILNFLFLYAVWKFAVTDELMPKLNWGGVAWFSGFMVAFMKVWFWMRMESNRTVREIKRVELQLAQIRLNLES